MIALIQAALAVPAPPNPTDCEAELADAEVRLVAHGRLGSEGSLPADAPVLFQVQPTGFNAWSDALVVTRLGSGNPVAFSVDYSAPLARLWFDEALAPDTIVEVVWERYPGHDGTLTQVHIGDSTGDVMPPGFVDVELDPQLDEDGRGRVVTEVDEDWGAIVVTAVDGVGGRVAAPVASAPSRPEMLLSADGCPLFQPTPWVDLRVLPVDLNGNLGEPVELAAVADPPQWYLDLQADADAEAPTVAFQEGCGCSSGTTAWAGSWVGLLGLLGLRRRR